MSIYVFSDSTLKEFETNKIKRIYLKIFFSFLNIKYALKYKIDMIKYKKYFLEIEEA